MINRTGAQNRNYEHLYPSTNLKCRGRCSHKNHVHNKQLTVFSPFISSYKPTTYSNARRVEGGL